MLHVDVRDLAESVHTCMADIWSVKHRLSRAEAKLSEETLMPGIVEASVSQIEAHAYDWPGPRPGRSSIQG